jgi:hypothetical protein
MVGRTINGEVSLASRDEDVEVVSRTGCHVSLNINQMSRHYG